MFKGKFDKKYIIPLIHFILTFVWEWLVLVPADRARVAFSIPMNETFSYGFEQVMCYVISKLMAGIIIFLIWKVVFAVAERKVSKETLAIFIPILAFAVFSVIVLWPDVFEAGGDNIIPYSYAIRLMPEYWHSIYLSCLYTASVMVFPHAVSINLLLAFTFVSAVGYLYNRIKTSPLFENARWLRFPVLFMFVFRDTFTVSTNPERAEYNASFTLIFLTIVLIDMLEMKKRTRGGFAALTIFAAFLAVFRSEGIIVAILSYVALVAVVYRPKLAKWALYLGGLAVIFVAFSLPPKVGEIKYYGSDYSIVNSFNPLHNIFCAESANLSYDGAEEDMTAIEAVTPVEMIKEFGSEGYRRFNYLNSRKDINQSMAGSEKSDRYKKAYANIVKHNLPIYVKTQWHMFMQAIGVPNATYVEEYRGEGTGVERFGSDIWDVGSEDFQLIPGRYTWVRNGIRNKIAPIITIPRMKYIAFLTESWIYTLFFVVEILFSVFVVIATLVACIKKKYSSLPMGLTALILDGYLLLLALVMPVGANMYFHAYIYCMFAVEIIWLIGNKKQKL